MAIFPTQSISYIGPFSPTLTPCPIALGYQSQANKDRRCEIQGEAEQGVEDEEVPRGTRDTEQASVVHGGQEGRKSQLA